MDQNKTALVFQVRVLLAQAAQTAYVAAEKFTIGSLPSLPIVLRDSSVDRQHLTISRIDSQIWLTDQHSAGGTRVNGRLLTPGLPQLYSPGDRIYVGEAECALQIFLLAPVTDAKAAPQAVAEPIVPADLEKHLEKVRAEMMERSQVQANALASKIIKEARAESDQLLQKAQSVYGENSQRAAEQARTEAAQITAAARADAEALIEESRALGLALERQAQENAQEIFRRAEQEAQSRTSAIISRAEDQARAQIKEQSLKAIGIRENALREAEAILNQAREQSARMLQNARLKMAEERAEESTRLLNQASADAESIRDAARLEAEKPLEAARVSATEIVNRAQVEADKLLAGARELIVALQDEARAETERLLAEAREQREEMLKARDAEALRLLEEARSQAAAITLGSHKEAERLRRRVLKEAAAGKLKAQHLDRIVESLKAALTEDPEREPAGKEYRSWRWISAAVGLSLLAIVIHFVK